MTYSVSINKLQEGEQLTITGDQFTPDSVSRLDEMMNDLDRGLRRRFFVGLGDFVDMVKYSSISFIINPSPQLPEVELSGLGIPDLMLKLKDRRGHNLYRGSERRRVKLRRSQELRGLSNLISL